MHVSVRLFGYDQVEHTEGVESGIALRRCRVGDGGVDCGNISTWATNQGRTSVDRRKCCAFGDRNRLVANTNRCGELPSAQRRHQEQAGEVTNLTARAAKTFEDWDWASYGTQYLRRRGWSLFRRE